MSWVKAITCSDDVFDEDVDDISLQNKEWRCNMEKRTKDGFRDGVDAGKEASLQVGFNLGYREGAGEMKAVAQLKGIVSALQCWCQSQSSELSSIDNLLRRVEQYEQDLVDAMRRAQERPPISLPEVAGDLEDLGLDQSRDNGDSDCSTEGRDEDGALSGQVMKSDFCGKDRLMCGNSLAVHSQNMFLTEERLEQLLQACVELVTEMGLPEELVYHVQQLRSI